MDERHPKVREALRRLLELADEACVTGASCRVAVELTFQKGVPQHVQDERRRYEVPPPRGGSGVN